MTAKSLAAAGLLPLLFACSVDRGPGPHPSKAVVPVEQERVSPETFALGSTVLPDGAMPQEATGEKFNRGSEVFLSVDVTGASTDQEIRVDWMDVEGRTVRRDLRRAPEGSKHVVFSSGGTQTWRRGQHRAVVVIDGRKVTERPFDLL